MSCCGKIHLVKAHRNWSPFRRHKAMNQHFIRTIIPDVATGIIDFKPTSTDYVRKSIMHIQRILIQSIHSRAFPLLLHRRVQQCPVHYFCSVIIRPIQLIVHGVRLQPPRQFIIVIPFQRIRGMQGGMRFEEGVSTEAHCVVSGLDRAGIQNV